MTLPISAPVSLSDVLTEIRRVTPSRALPISLGDADVRALASKPSGAISLSDLYGKSSYIPMTVTANYGEGFAESAASGGVVSCSPSVSVTGGSGGYVITWAFVGSSQGCTLSAAPSPSCIVSIPYTKSSTGSVSVVVRATITDSTNHTVTQDVNASLEWHA